jgi:hypothetical protein
MISGKFTFGKSSKNIVSGGKKNFYRLATNFSLVSPTIFTKFRFSFALVLFSSTWKFYYFFFCDLNDEQKKNCFCFENFPLKITNFTWSLGWRW